ncbi:MAG: type II secretion system protein [Patescibacteria group bacterium]
MDSTSSPQARKKGFTLIEILVVIGIMGTLVAIVLPNFIGGRQRSKDAKRRIDLETISSALEQYRNVAGTYPATLTLDCDPDRETLTYTDPVTTTVTTFLTAIPQDPGCGLYVYAIPQLTDTDYTVCAYLEASTPSTDAAGACGGTSPKACNYCKGPYGAK